MTFGYNADAAFGQSTAEIVDHAKSLLASLVDKREEPEVQSLEKCRLKKILILWEEIQHPLIFITHSLGEFVVKQVRQC